MACVSEAPAYPDASVGHIQAGQRLEAAGRRRRRRCLLQVRCLHAATAVHQRIQKLEYVDTAGSGQGKGKAAVGVVHVSAAPVEETRLTLQLLQTEAAVVRAQRRLLVLFGLVIRPVGIVRQVAGGTDTGQIQRPAPGLSLADPLPGAGNDRHLALESSAPATPQCRPCPR